ncbi:uncharacterized protein [Aegilops tauschii subsp. strangulata]|uniref:uncharacterized protein isoform X1 n=1 Tax=Aegilops tauschii subsp. strangulata TaxID=200361 RepID=UPI003CC86D06
MSHRLCRHGRGAPRPITATTTGRSTPPPRKTISKKQILLQGPNPLSCRKRKQSPNHQLLNHQGLMADGEAKRKTVRKRKRSGKDISSLTGFAGSRPSSNTPSVPPI